MFFGIHTGYRTDKNQGRNTQTERGFDDPHIGAVAQDCRGHLTHRFAPAPVRGRRHRLHAGRQQPGHHGQRDRWHRDQHLRTCLSEPRKTHLERLRQRRLHLVRRCPRFRTDRHGPRTPQPEELVQQCRADLRLHEVLKARGQELRDLLEPYGGGRAGQRRHSDHLGGFEPRRVGLRARLLCHPETQPEHAGERQLQGAVLPRLPRPACLVRQRSDL